MQFALGLLANIMEAYFPVEDPNPVAIRGISTGSRSSPAATRPVPVHTCTVLAR